MKLQKILHFLMAATVLVSSATLAAGKHVHPIAKPGHPKAVRAYPTAVNSSREVKPTTHAPTNHPAHKPSIQSEHEN